MLNVIACECGKLVKCEYIEDHYIAICECGHDTIIQEPVFDVYNIQRLFKINNIKSFRRLNIEQ